MGYLNSTESEARIARVRGLLEARDLDFGAGVLRRVQHRQRLVSDRLVPAVRKRRRAGAPRTARRCILGGPESEPFAKLDSAITETRNFPVFMVPDEEYPNATIIDFPKLFAELNASVGSESSGVGLVGAGRMPADCYRQIVEGFAGVELVDITR